MDDGKYYKLHSDTHFVTINNMIRVYGFDSFVNHSCDPTIVYSRISPTLYIAHAHKDINIGNEIACDYAMTGYECKGYMIHNCQCGSKNCRQFIGGFKYLTLFEKLKLIPFVDKRLRLNFLFDIIIYFYPKLSYFYINNTKSNKVENKYILSWQYIFITIIL